MEKSIQFAHQYKIKNKTNNTVNVIEIVEPEIFHAIQICLSLTPVKRY
jgi:hypothetical protein